MQIPKYKHFYGNINKLPMPFIIWYNTVLLMASKEGGRLYLVKAGLNSWTVNTAYPILKQTFTFMWSSFASRIRVFSILSIAGVLIGGLL